LFQEIISFCNSNDIRLIAVSKTKSAAEIESFYKKGQLDFGENRVQELVVKQSTLAKDIRWHMIGHLQRNKVKQIVPFIHLIHSIDSLKLLLEVNKQGESIGRNINVLLQLKIANESTKYGLKFSDACEIIDIYNKGKLTYINLCGVMGMASFVENQKTIRDEFSTLKKIHIQLKDKLEKDKKRFMTISMGMSQDYKIAAECGTTMIRIGSLLFGSR